MRTNLSKAAAGILLAAVFAIPANAQDTEPLLVDEVLVTASRLPVSLEQTPGSTTLLSREEIEALAPATTADLLRMLPGLHLSGGGGSGTPGFLHTRGADPNLTTVYIDGVRVNDPTDSRGGAFDFNMIDPSEIERIEIVRGPLSSVHGSSALAGAVSIVTTSSEPARIWANTEAGGDQYLRASLGTGYAGEDWHRQLRLSHHKEGEVVPGNDFLSQSLDLNLQDGGNDLSFRYNRSEREGFPDTSGGPLYAENREVEREESNQLQLQLATEMQFRGRGSVGMVLSGFQKDSVRETPEISNFSPAAESDGRYRRGEIELNLRSGDENERAVIGVALSSELGDTEGTRFDALGPGVDLPTDFRLHRRIGSFYSEGLRHHRHFTLQTSVRLDAPDGGSSEWSPRIGLRHPLRWGGGSLKANWGESFKLASLYALGDPLVGNPDLKNETSRGWDVAWVQPLLAQKIEFELGYHDSRYEELIDFDFGAFQMVNLNAVDISGIELAIRAQPATSLRLQAQLSQSRSEIRGSGDALQDRPEWTASASARWSWKDDNSIGLRLRHVGAVPDNSAATGFVELDAYTRVDLIARYVLAPRWTLNVAVDNLFDEIYEEAAGFASPGIRPRVGISYR